MNIKTKITLFSGIVAFVLILLLLSITLLSFRQFAINLAKDNNETMAEIIRTNLTESMVNGVINKRESLLERISQVEGLVDARVIRSPKVSEQFGEGLNAEMPDDSIDMQVIDSGQSYFAIEEDGLMPVFRSTIPFTATKEGTPNCLQCHNVSEGTVLGAVTLTRSTSHLVNQAFYTALILVLSISLIAIFAVFFLRKLVQPLVNTAEDVQETVEQALVGDFSGRISISRKDEIGQIAKDINHLMAYMNDSLTQMQNDVVQLTKTKPEKSDNLLEDTTRLVESLIEAAHFKQAIEEDETSAEVYSRVSRMLQVDFGLHQFSIYEVNAEKNQIKTKVVDGGLDAECKWCSEEILVRSEACRARRTGHIIDSFDCPQICNSFASDNDNHRHICIPVIQSGSVGSVVQIVEDAKDIPRLKSELPYLQVYLREAAPVIQGKRLMDKLHESTLRDPMTGLHNRRFLEEYVDTLVAAARRDNMHFVILMADLDFFKLVNDELGHDAGDKLLKELAKCFVRTVRASDMVIRYGGEEFLIILRNTDKENGLMVAEKIRASVEEMKVQVGGAVINKTLSVGVADFPDDSNTFWQTVKYADVALYNAKDTGRNKVVAFTPELWDEDGHY